MDNVPEKPLDQRAREAEQYSFHFEEEPKQEKEKQKEASPCGRVGYCYCPKCNPR